MRAFVSVTGYEFRMGVRRWGVWAAFVLAEERARLRQLETGRSSGTETQVISGLKAGDRVILYPGNRIRPGQRVTPIKIS